MSATLEQAIEIQQQQMSEDCRLRFSVSDYRKIAEAGILPAKPKTELIRGVIYMMLPIGRPHGICTALLHSLFATHLSIEHWAIFDQVTVEFDDESAPEPDLCILRGSPRAFEAREPRVDEYAYLIEVAQTSLKTDRTTKLSLYAEHGVSDYWIVNLVDRVIEAYSQPYTDANSGQSIYKNCHIYAEQDSVTMPFDSLSPLVFKVADILPGKSAK